MKKKWNPKTHHSIKPGIVDEELAILDWLSYEKEKAQKELKETQRIGGHSCYGAGVEWGVIDTCQRLEDFINGIEQ